MDKVEDDMKQQLNEDRINKEDKVADGMKLEITERKIQVLAK